MTLSPGAFHGTEEGMSGAQRACARAVVRVSVGVWGIAALFSPWWDVGRREGQSQASTRCPAPVTSTSGPPRNQAVLCTPHYLLAQG